MYLSICYIQEAQDLICSLPWNACEYRADANLLRQTSPSLLGVVPLLWVISSQPEPIVSCNPVFHLCLARNSLICLNPSAFQLNRSLWSPCTSCWARRHISCRNTWGRKITRCPSLCEPSTPCSAHSTSLCNWAGIPFLGFNEIEASVWRYHACIVVNSHSHPLNQSVTQWFNS